MFARQPDGYRKTAKVIASLSHEVRVEALRIWVQSFYLIFFGGIFLILVAGETLFAAMMFAIIQIEILGTVFSGAAFALLTPTVIGYSHVRLHHEGDHFLRSWLRTLSGIGILVFALGVSLSIGYAAWQATSDVMSAMSSGPTGSLGSQSVTTDADASSGLAGWIAIIPNSMLFLGLSFGLIITISFASFCLGRALQAFNILTLTPRIGKDVKERIKTATEKIAQSRRLRNENDAERAKLPFDLKAKFAREASHVCGKAVQAKLAAAQRVFDRAATNDPLTAILCDPDAGAIPSRFKTEEDYDRHMADVRDSTRAYKILTVLTGTSEGKDQI